MAQFRDGRVNGTFLSSLVPVGVVVHANFPTTICVLTTRLLTPTLLAHTRTWPEHHGQSGFHKVLARHHTTSNGTFV